MANEFGTIQALVIPVRRHNEIRITLCHVSHVDHKNEPESIHFDRLRIPISFTSRPKCRDRIEFSGTKAFVDGAAN
jgi:hypothetical protein